MGLESLNAVNAAQANTQGTETKLYDTKEKRKAAINQAISNYMKNGSSDGAKIYADKKEYKAAVKAQNKERKAFVKQLKAQGKTKAFARQEFDKNATRIAFAEDEAKKYIKNEQYKEEFETYNEETTVYADKKAYKAAKKENSAARKELYKSLRQQGLSRKEAKAQVNEQIPEIELAARSARKGFAKLGLVEKDGTLGKKALQYMVKQANIGNVQEGEVTSYHYELKERRATQANERAKGNKLTLHALGKMADAVGLHKEKNLTGPMRIIAGAAIVTSSAGLGSLAGGINAASTAGAIATSASESVSAGPAGTAIAASEAFAKSGSNAGVKIGGALLGTTAGTVIAGLVVPFIKDHGKKVVHTFAPGQPPVEPKKDEPKVEPKKDEKKEEKTCPTQTWESKYCDHTVTKKGENWSNVAQGKVKINGKKLEGKMLQAYVHAEKLQHGVTDFSQNTFRKKGENYRLYTDFSNLLDKEEIVKKHPELLMLKDAQIEIDCDGKYTVSNNGTPKKPYVNATHNPFATNAYKQSCDDNVPVRTNNN